MWFLNPYAQKGKEESARKLQSATAAFVSFITKMFWGVNTAQAVTSVKTMSFTQIKA